MAIFERLTATDETKIPVHAFAGLCRIRLSMGAGGIGGQIATGMIAAFELSAGDQAELTAIINAHNAITNANAGVQAANRLEYALRVHDTFLAAEAGLLTKAQCQTILGF